VSDLAKNILDVLDSGRGDKQSRLNEVRELCDGAAKPAKKAKKKDKYAPSDNAAKEGAAA